MIFAIYFLNNVTYYLQLNEYNPIKNLKTIVTKLSIDVILIYFAPCVVTFILNLLLSGSKILWLFVLFEIVTFFALSFVLSSSKSNRKVKLKLTKRFLRIYILTLVLLMGLTSYVGYELIFRIPHYFGIIYLLPIAVVVCNIVALTMLYPFEKIMYYYYLNDAVKILERHGGIVNIAITGSFGKTSTKFILKTILSEKYNVCATPNSYNTPIGITKTIREILSPTHDIFIMEFGAKKRGEIKYLCKKFKPNMGIITSVGMSHLQSFGSVENIMETKNELAKNLYGSNPYMVFGNDNKYVKCCYDRCTYDKECCGCEEGLNVKNVICYEGGSKFDIYIKDNYYITCKTKLIGEHNINNILLCVAMAIKLRLSKQQIINGIAKLQPVAGRMEITPHSSGAVIINDGYNSNPTSARIAVDTLKLFTNRRKLVVTPGMVELGDAQYKENYEWAKYMAGLVDRVIIVNEINKDAIVKGLLIGGMNEKDIIRTSSLKETIKNLKNNDVLLIENDLPDNYD